MAAQAVVSVRTRNWWRHCNVSVHASHIAVQALSPIRVNGLHLANTPYSVQEVSFALFYCPLVPSPFLPPSLPPPFQGYLLPEEFKGRVNTYKQLTPNCFYIIICFLLVPFPVAITHSVCAIIPLTLYHLSWESITYTQSVSTHMVQHARNLVPGLPMRIKRFYACMGKSGNEATRHYTAATTHKQCCIHQDHLSLHLSFLSLMDRWANDLARVCQPPYSWLHPMAGYRTAVVMCQYNSWSVHGSSV